MPKGKYLHPRRHGDAVHGSETAEWYAWKAMKDRCYVITHHQYGRYGGRGIRVCAKWRNSFPVFLEDVGRKPSPSHSLDRIDNNGNYEPGNVRWATKIEQARNRRDNRFLTVNGETRCLREWEQIKELPLRILSKRLRRGWLEDRLLIPSQRGKNDGR